MGHKNGGFDIFYNYGFQNVAEPISDTFRPISATDSITAYCNYEIVCVQAEACVRGFLQYFGTVAPPNRGELRSGRIGCFLPSRLGGWGSVVISPSGVQSGAPAGNAFWRILKAT